MQQISIRIKDETLNEIAQLRDVLNNHNETGLKVTTNGLIRDAVYTYLENKNNILHNVEKLKSFPLILRAKDYSYQVKDFKPEEMNDMEAYNEKIRLEGEAQNKAIDDLDAE